MRGLNFTQKYLIINKILSCTKKTLKLSVPHAKSDVFPKNAMRQHELHTVARVFESCAVVTNRNGPGKRNHTAQHAHQGSRFPVKWSVFHFFFFIFSKFYAWLYVFNEVKRKRSDFA